LKKKKNKVVKWGGRPATHGGVQDSEKGGRCRRLDSMGAFERQFPLDMCDLRRGYINRQPKLPAHSFLKGKAWMAWWEKRSGWFLWYRQGRGGEGSSTRKKKNECRQSFPGGDGWGVKYFKTERKIQKRGHAPGLWKETGGTVKKRSPRPDSERRNTFAKVWELKGRSIVRRKTLVCQARGL